MNRDQLTALTEATALTRAGRTAEATAVIQRALSGLRPRDDTEDAVPRAAEPGAPRGCPEGGLRTLLRERLSRAATRAARAADLAGGLPTTTPRERARPRTPALPGRTSVHTHSGPAGDRPYTLYVPTTGEAPRPLVVMLHGGTQTVDDFAAATGMSALAGEHGFVVAYPEQVTGANPMRYWNWFRPEDQRRGAGEPAILAGIVAEITAAHGVDPDRVYVAGFSAGAAMASVMAAAYPDLVAAVGVHSGLAAGSAHDVPSAFAAMREAPPAGPVRRPVPVIAFHGDADPTVAVGNATRVVEQLTGGPVHGDTLVERGPGRPATRTLVRRGGAVVGEHWAVHGSGHAWSGGAAGGSYTDPAGPNASAEMVRFFAANPRR